MNVKRFLVFVGFAAMVSLVHTACTPEDIDPFDPSETDSLWTDPCDTTDYGDDYDDDSTDIDLGDGDEPTDSTDFGDDWGDDWPDDDTTGTDGTDSLFFGG